MATKKLTPHTRILTTALESRIVFLIAGVRPAAQEFGVHKDLLCNSSTYFAAAFRNDFEESRTGRFRFDDVVPTTIKALVSWLYLGRLYDAKDPAPVKPANEDPEESDEPGDDNGIRLDFEDITAVWVFGDRIGAPTLQNAALDLFNKRAERCKIRHHVVSQIYRVTTPGSVLRRYIIRFMAGCNTSGAYFKPELLPKEVWVDLCHCLMDARPATSIDANSGPGWAKILKGYHIAVENEEEVESV